MITKTLISSVFLFIEVFAISLICLIVFIILFILINFIKYEKKSTNNTGISFYNFIKHNLFRYLKRIILFLVSLVLIFIVFFSLGTLRLYYIQTHTEQVDISFFTEQLKSDILSIEKNINNIGDFNGVTISYYYGKVTYYKSENIPLEKEIPLDVKELMKENNISFIRFDNTSGQINVNFVSDHYIYLYTNKYKYQDGDLLLSGLSGRVEEVIDDNWYVIKLCSDIDMCP